MAPQEVVYDGAVHKPSVTLVTVHDSKIDPANYEVVYGGGDWTSVGTYPVRVNFLVDYTNSPVAYFTIRPGEVAGGSATFSPAEMRYVKSKFGAVAEPVPTVRLADGTVVPPSAYTVNWLGGRTWPTAGTWAPGTYTAEIRFAANYAGTLTNTFTIVSNPDYYFTEYGTREEALAHVGDRADGSGKRKRILYIGGSTNDLMTAYVLKQIHDDLDLNELIIANFVVWTEDPTADGSSFDAFAEGLDVKAQPLFAVLSEHDLTRPLAGLAGYHTNERLRAFLEEALKLPDDASSATLTLARSLFDHTGSPVRPTGTVTYGGTTVPPEHYRLEYAEGCTDLGEYWVKAVFASSDFGGYGLTGETARVAFAIAPRVLKASDVSLAPESAVYDGSVHRPSVTVPDGVACDVDYGLGYYVATGDYAIAVISAEPTCTGRVEKTFTIAPRAVAADAVTVELDQDAVAYSPVKAPTNAVRPTVTRLTDGTRTYVEGRDYDVVYGPGSWMTNGNYEVRIVFKNGYSGTVTVPFAITIAAKVDASAAVLALAETEFVYDGTKRTPAAESVVFAGETIAPEHYELVCDPGCVTAGVYGARAVFRGAAYTGETARAYFTIAPLAVTNATVELSATNYVFKAGVARDAPVRPTVTRVSDGARGYSRDADYTVAYGPGDWTANGVYTVVVTFVNNYAGTATATFEIGEAEPEALPELGPESDTDDVTNAISRVEWSDPDVTERVTNAVEYAGFRAWCEAVDAKGGDGTAAASATAYASYRLSELTGTSTNFESTAGLSFEIADLDVAADPVPGCSSPSVAMTVSLVDGGSVVSLADTQARLDAAKEAFARLVRRAKALDALDTGHVTADEIAVSPAGGGKVTLRIDPPSGGTGFIRLTLE